MYNVSAEFKMAAQNPARTYTLTTTITRGATAITVGSEKIYSVKITDGATSGGSNIGSAFCPVLNISYYADVDIREKDIITVSISFVGASDVVNIARCYVDKVTQSRLYKNCVAYGEMIQTAKYYRSSLTYPCLLSDVLDEISARISVPVSDDFALINNQAIMTKPIKATNGDGSTQWYTYREMLGYIAGINGGNAYIDGNNEINITSSEIIQGETIVAAQATSAAINGSEYTIENVVWNTSGVTYALEEDYSPGTLEFFNPLKFYDKTTILRNLTSKLAGTSYTAMTLSTQGRPYHQIGDIITYTDLNGDSYNVMISGLTYDFSSGAFSETIYSLAPSEMEQQYAGNQIVSGNVNADINTLQTLYARNTRAVVVNATEKVICSISYQMNTVVTPFVSVTVPITVTEGGTLTLGVYNNSALVQEFSQDVVAGNHFKALSLPILGLGVGSHTTSVNAKMITGGGTVAATAANITLIATGLGAAAWDGTLSASESISPIGLVPLTGGISVGDYNVTYSADAQNTSATAYAVAMGNIAFSALSAFEISPYNGVLKLYAVPTADYEGTTTIVLTFDNPITIENSAAVDVTAFSISGLVGDVSTSITVVSGTISGRELTLTTSDFSDFSGTIYIEYNGTTGNLIQALTENNVDSFNTSFNILSTLSLTSFEGGES